MAIDGICSTEYWNIDLTWNTYFPIFTPCFLKIALIWGPVAFFWIFTPTEIYYTSKSKEKKIPWSTLNIAKLLTSVLLLILSASDMCFQMFLYTRTAVPPVDYYTPFLLFVTVAKNTNPIYKSIHALLHSSSLVHPESPVLVSNAVLSEIGKLRYPRKQTPHPSPLI
ncbi:ATP-binding cassette sub-family C member 2-like [Uloborus diversus]|uniref:ATP-binding cassette sub-family C member 2-like n=1 Tax=Uloborus diversus TaxID=327109 RepID=UPI00240A51D5|nr:ATP-binding cassette sub-family C member 2-like [Uloborus diversus]